MPKRLLPNENNHKWWTLFAMCFALFMIMLDNTVVNVALPSIQKDLHASPSNLEWTVNAYILSFAVLMMLGGTLGDRYGRKKIFLLGLAVFTGSSALCALSTTDSMLIAARVLQGVGAAMLNPLSLSILTNSFPRKQLPTAIGVWAGISGLGLAIGPLFGGFLVEHVDWSAVFWINVPIGFVAAAVTLFAVKNSSDPSARKFDIPGTALITGGLFLAVWGLIKTNSHSWASVYVWSFLISAFICIALFVWWESRNADPMVPLGFFKIRAFSISTMVITLVGFALFGVIYFVTLYFQNVKGWTALQAGVRTLPLTMMVIFVGPIVGKLNTKIGPRPLVTAGMLAASVGLFGLAHLTPASPYSQIWPFYILIGAGIAMTLPSVSSAGMGAVDITRSGVASGVLNTSRQIGSALGIAVLGAIGAAVIGSKWDPFATNTLHLTGKAASGVKQMVLGGQGEQVGHIAGSAAQAHALSAFTSGVVGAMWVAMGLTLIASLTAFFGLRNTTIAHMEPNASSTTKAST